MGKEIERKWLFNSNNDPLETNNRCDGYNIISSYEYYQAYISKEPELRIRKKVYSDGKKTYAMTVKGKGNLSRVEVQTPITEDEFKDLMSLREYKLLTNFIYKETNLFSIPNSNLQLVIGKVTTPSPSMYNEMNQSETFCYGEIEFKSEKEALEFVPPKWFGEEVTNNPDYKMSSVYYSRGIDKNS